jgi:hypothetical protein
MMNFTASVTWMPHLPAHDALMNNRSNQFTLGPKRTQVAEQLILLD